MKAIVKVAKGSAYSKLNGHTFEIKSLLNNLVCLDINGVSTDFSLKEIIVVDLLKEIETFNKGGNVHSTLLKYAELNSIVLDEVKPKKISYKKECLKLDLRRQR